LYHFHLYSSSTEAGGEKFDVKYSGICAGFLCFEWRMNIHQHIAEIMVFLGIN